MNNIPTKYKGILFRSRLEARWALYFDLIKLPWIYEAEGFELENKEWYVPDFYIPGEKIYIEIKPESEEIEGLRICKLFPKTIALFIGFPSEKTHRLFSGGEEVETILFDSTTTQKWGTTPLYAGGFIGYMYKQGSDWAADEANKKSFWEGR